MSFANVILLVVLASFSICVQCYINHPIRMRSIVNTRSNIVLHAAIHDAAEKGDLEAIMEMVNKDISNVSRYDIDGKFSQNESITMSIHDYNSMFTVV